MTIKRLIGSSPSQVSRNRDLGTMAFQNKEAITVDSATINGGTANGVAYLNGSKVLTTGSGLTFDGSSMVLNTSTSSDALRITQTGTGNALVVEDSTSPDSTPFVITSNGRVILNNASVGPSGINYNFQNLGKSASEGMALGMFTNDTDGMNIRFAKSRSTTVGSFSAVQADDELGIIAFYGDGGSDLNNRGASIVAYVDGTVATNSIPSRIVFSTTAVGGTSTTERMRLDSNGNVGIGVSPVQPFTAARSISGGAPAASGSAADPNGVARFQYGSVVTDFGAYSNGTVWIQNRSVNNYATKYDLAFQPNGGNTLHVGPNGGLGYGAGAGGTVTQATSKGTTVTLNKPTGQITMNNSALAAGAKVTFAVNNSLVTVSDVPHVVVASNSVGDSARYRASCTYVGAGAFYITVENIGAVSYSDNVYINFAIIKGAAA